MSRLIQLLTEKETTPVMSNIGDTGAGETGKEYLLNTPAGNLFRLMLILNPHQSTLQTGSSNLVSKMLAEIVENKETPETTLKTIRSMQTSYNKIKRATLANKRAPKNIKEDYFQDLFTLLVPMTGQDNFNIETMAKQFAINAPKAHAFQRRSAVLIGKSLLANKVVKLNGRDSQLIRGYIAGLDAIDGIEAEKDSNPEDIEDVSTLQHATVAEAQPKNAVTKVIDKDTPTEKLRDVINKSDLVSMGIKGQNKDNSVALGEFLKTNESSEPYKVALTGSDAPFNDLINAKIIHFYEQTKLQHGVEVANFITKMCSDALKHLNDANGYIAFVKGEVDMDIEKIDKGLRISMKVGKSVPPEHQFFMVKSYRDDNGSFVVNHDKVQIPGAAQNTGINKKLFKDVLDLYKAEGVSKITLEANVDVGGYAWFRYGFTPVDQDQLDTIADWMVAVAPLVSSATKYDYKELAQFIEEKTFTATKGTTNLINLIKQGHSPQLQKVIENLFHKCSEELRITFDDKSKFKGLAKNIAIMNFKDYKIAGNVYSISYKALLSIQSFRVNGAKPIPMIRGVHLNWKGELNMNDLDDTYAYLSMKKA